MKTNPGNSSVFYLLPLIFFSMNCAKDLRRGLVKDSVPVEAQEQGRKVLAAATQAHGGLPTWQQKRTTTVSMTDDWQGFFVRTFGNPWPESHVIGQMSFINGTMTSRTDFIAGKSSGNSWGVLDDSRTWEIRRGESRKTGKNEDIRFIQRAIHYLNELPFRISREATNITFMDTTTLNGKKYHRILATWGQDFSVSTDYDQYVLYINAETLRVEKANYTVRDFMRFAEGCMHFDDFRQVEGIQFPFTQTVTIGCDAENYQQDYMHQIKVSEVRFNQKDAGYISPMP